MKQFHPRTPDFEAKIRASFAKQPLMSTIGATLSHVAPGVAEILLPFDNALTQHHGYTHAGIITTIDWFDLLQPRNIAVWPSDVTIQAGGNNYAS